MGEGGVGQPEPERAQRGRVGRRHLGRAAEDGLEVGVGLCAAGAGQGDREPAGRVHRSGDDVGDGEAAAFAGEEGLEHRGRAAVRTVQRPPDGIGTAGDEHQHHGCPGGQHRLDQLALHPGQGQRVGVVAFPDGAAAEEPGLVTDHHHGHIGRGGGRDGIGEAGAVVALDTRSRARAPPRSQRRTHQLLRPAPRAPWGSRCPPGTRGSPQGHGWRRSSSPAGPRAGRHSGRSPPGAPARGHRGRAAARPSLARSTTDSWASLRASAWSCGESRSTAVGGSSA